MHLSRLLPLLPKPTRASTRTSQSDSSPKTTTAGQTSIYGKFYPLRLRPWPEFLREHRAVFSSLQEQLGDNGVFPPRREVQLLEANLQETIPTRFLNTHSFHNHARTAAFLDLAVEKPSSKVLAQYFAAAGQDTAVYFDNMTSGVAGSSRTAIVAEDGEDGPAVLSNTSDSPALQTPTKTRPDCVVLARDAWSDHTAPDPEPRRLVVGEHKPCHSLRAADLQSKPLLLEDILVRMAIARQRRKATKKQLLSVGTDAPSPSDSFPTMPAKQTFFASALAQTYHYMVVSGLEYGYLATGETITFLRIPFTEPTTLLYHTSIFPAVDPKDLPQADGAPVYPSGVTVLAALQADQPHDDSLAALAISQLCSLCLFAVSSPVRTQSWVAETLRLLTPFPGVPPGYRRASLSPLGLRRRDESDDGRDDDDETGGGLSSRGRLRLPSLHGEDNRAPSPLRQAHQAAGSSQGKRAVALSGGTGGATKEKAVRPYCTQKCLLGLIRGLPFDAACPNYSLHSTAAPAATPTPRVPGRGEVCKASQPQQEHRQVHAITQAELEELVLAQIAAHPENNCRLLDKEGLVGAVGYLLKITVNGYGYTFVAKAVESFNAHRLRKETRIYVSFYRQQGVLIPVHLGLVKLRSPYPFMAQFTTLSHFMLLSYTGETLHHGPSLDALGQKLGRDLNQEIRDTYQALHEWGLNDLDTDVYNATWCDETQRVVKIDFDHCYLDMDVYAAKSAVEDGAAQEPAQETAEIAEETAQGTVRGKARGAAQAEALPQKRNITPDHGVDGEMGEMGWAPAAKRTKLAMAGQRNACNKRVNSEKCL